MSAYQCTECGEPLVRGRCPDRECSEEQSADFAPDFIAEIREAESAIELGDVATLDELVGVEAVARFEHLLELNTSPTASPEAP